MLQFQSHDAGRTPQVAVGRAARTLLVNLLVLAFLVILAEGFLSVALFTADTLSEKVSPERAHTRHDPDLGWAPVPNLEFPNMYGPGGFLRTNTQGFRGAVDYTEVPPPGKRRVICSGDSVTFGYGVDDEHAWCRLLETIDPRLETINMALPGYGVDQAYLWYKRDAGRFHHHVHLFAPVTDDFRRMQSARFNGYGRPTLALDGGRLVVRNVPVAAASYRVPWWTEIKHHFWSLRSVHAIRRLNRSLLGSAPAAAAPADREAHKQAADEQTEAVVGRLLLDLQALNEARGSILVVVYLPSLNDRGPSTDFWLGVLERECKALGIPFLNLVKTFDRMSDDEAVTLYLPGDLGHFSRDGNAYVARLIYEKLTSLPEVSRILLAPESARIE